MQEKCLREALGVVTAGDLFRERAACLHVMTPHTARWLIKVRVALLYGGTRVVSLGLIGSGSCDRFWCSLVSGGLGALLRYIAPVSGQDAARFRLYPAVRPLCSAAWVAVLSEIHRVGSTGCCLPFSALPLSPGVPWSRNRRARCSDRAGAGRGSGNSQADQVREMLCVRNPINTGGCWFLGGSAQCLWSWRGSCFCKDGMFCVRSLNAKSCLPVVDFFPP